MTPKRYNACPEDRRTTERLTLRVPKRTLAELDAIRGNLNRSQWVAAVVFDTYRAIQPKP